MTNSLWIKASSIIQGMYLLVLSSSFGAEPMRLSLEQAVQTALERNLELKTKREELGIAEGRLLKANLLLQHNPELEGEVSNFRVTRGEESGRNATNHGLELSQEFEIGGQPRYRREAARGNLEKVKLEVKDFERILRFRVAEIFLKLQNVQAKIKQGEQNVDLRSRLYEASKTRLSLGDIPEVQLTISEFELNRSRSDLIGLQREHEEVIYRLRTELALESEVPIEILGDLQRTAPSFSLQEFLKTAVERRSDLAASEREKQVAEAEERLTRAERIPNIKLGVFYDREKQDGAYIAGGRISIPIPVFDRKQGELREALARRSIANLNYLNRRQALEKEIGAAYARFKLAERELSLYPEGTQKKFEESLDLYRRAYEERAIDLADAILFQNQVIEARQKFIDALTNYNLSLAELKFQAGIE